ncbi:hypothetical protein SteCoe_14401 [Stentor coeruleus]|uniref:Uncharacterized protein n=1 Tax=Stentor coeruleus TaxID=5963 RepID=A0A1R2C638_9CILI|nr:hypothetical protein SteCoe_14401 [Stentor coeruleus]
MFIWISKFCCVTAESPKQSVEELKAQDNSMSECKMLYIPGNDNRLNIFGYNKNCDDMSILKSSPRFGGNTKSGTGGTEEVIKVKKTPKRKKSKQTKKKPKNFRSEFQVTI